LLNWKALRMEWHRRQAIEDATREGAESNLSDLSANYEQTIGQLWKSLAAGGEEGFQVLSKLLLHRDSRVWAHAVVMLDYGFHSLQFQPPVEVISALRKHGQLTLLRYLLPCPYQHHTQWRESIEDLLLDEGEKWLNPEPVAIRFCDAVLQGEVDGESLGC